jgi:hypothetical protein
MNELHFLLGLITILFLTGIALFLNERRCNKHLEKLCRETITDNEQILTHLLRARSLIIEAKESPPDERWLDERWFEEAQLWLIWADDKVCK